jgi:hypothetical protein
MVWVLHRPAACFPVPPAPPPIPEAPDGEEPPGPSESKPILSTSTVIAPLGLDRLGLIQAIGGLALGLIALFSSYDHITLAGRTLHLQQQWASPSSLPRWRLFLSMLNWRGDPGYEQRMMQDEQGKLQHEQERLQHEQRIKQLENDFLQVESDILRVRRPPRPGASAQGAAAAVLVPRRHEEPHQGDGDQSEHNPAEEGFNH